MAHPPQGTGGEKPNWLNHIKLYRSEHWKICCEGRTTLHWQLSDFCHSSKSQHLCHFGSDVFLWLGSQGCQLSHTWEQPEGTRAMLCTSGLIALWPQELLWSWHQPLHSGIWPMADREQQPQHTPVPSHPPGYHSMKLRASGSELSEDWDGFCFFWTAGILAGIWFGCRLTTFIWSWKACTIVHRASDKDTFLKPVIKTQR